jgi:hypothetical protein
LLFAGGRGREERGEGQEEEEEARDATPPTPAIAPLASRFLSLFLSSPPSLQTTPIV